MNIKIYLPMITLLFSLCLSPLAIAQVAIDDYFADYSAQETRPVTFDDVVDLKAVDAAQISPDGTQVIYTVRQFEPDASDNGQMHARTRIWKVSIADGASSAHQLTFGEQGDTQPMWSPDQRYISFLSARGTGENVKAQLYVMRADGGEAWKLTDAKEGVTNYAWAPDSLRIAYTSVDARSADEEAQQKSRDDAQVFESDFRYTHVWVIDLASKESTRITEGTDFTVIQPVWSPDGTRLVFQGNRTTMLRDTRHDLYIATVESKTVEKINNTAGAHRAPEWSPDGRTIAYLVRVADEAPVDGTTPRIVQQQRLMLYDVATRTSRDVTGNLTVAPEPITWSADSASLYFATGTRAWSEVWSLDIANGEFSQLTSGRVMQLHSISHEIGTLAGIVSSSKAPFEVFVSDTEFDSPKVLTDSNPQARSFAIGETEVFTWTSSDGMEIEGVLLKPVGYQPGQQYPLLVVAHGGPASAYTDGYRVGGLEGGQALAGEGWAVFYPNPRGSTNYGNAFLSANVRDWGGGDYRDIMTGVDALIARGIADPERMAHIGWSYGGYMTAWVVSQTSRFKAAMVGAGLTNLLSMYGTNDIPNLLIDYFGGNPSRETMPLYQDRSALHHIHNVTTPTLLLHGAQDVRVPPGQSYEMFRALRERGVATELVLYPREGHGILEYYHQKDRMQRIRDWITTHTLQPN